MPLKTPATKINHSESVATPAAGGLELNHVEPLVTPVAAATISPNHAESLLA